MHGARIGVRIIPVIIFAALDIRVQIGRVMDARGVDGVEVEMRRPVAPVGEREVVVDADEVDVGVRPQRIEIEIDIVAAVGRPVIVELGPVGRIADLHRRPEDPRHVGGKRAQRVDEGIGRRAGADLAHADHFRADQEGRNAAGELRQPGAVQEEPAIRPFRRSVIAHGGSLGVEMPRRGGADKGRHLGGGTRRLVDAAGIAGRRRAGDAAAPRIGGLAEACGAGRPGVRQAVAGGNVHHDERADGDAVAARGKLADRPDDAGIVRRAAIGRLAADHADQFGLRPDKVRHQPFERRRLGRANRPSAGSCSCRSADRRPSRG